MDNIMNNDTCRLCLCTDDTLLYPVDTRITWRNQDYPLAFRIIVCVGTDILPDDGLPQKVCHRCLYMIDVFFDFKESCEATEKFLIAGLNSAAGRIQKQKHILSLYSANDDKTSEIVNEMKQAPDDDDDDSLHESIVMYNSAVEEQLLKSPPPSDTDTEEVTSLAKENYETNSDEEIGAITSKKNDREVGNKLINENKQSSPNKSTTLALNIDGRSSELLTEKSKNSRTNNEVETTIPVIDKYISILPTVRTDERNSSEMSTGNNEKSTTDNQLEATVSDIDKDICMLPVERIEQSNLSNGVTSSKVNRKERRRDTKESTADNQLEATVSVIDIDSAELPIERTEQSDSSDGIASSKGNRKERRRNTKKSTADNQLEATVSVIDIDSAELPIERTEQSDSSDGIVSSKGNRKERRRNTKKSTADNQLEATVSVIDIDSAKLPIERTEQSDSSDGIVSSKGNRKERRRNTKKSTADNQLEATVSVIDIDSAELPIERTEQSDSSDGIVSSKGNRKERRRNTKKSTADNQLEATVSVIDIDSAKLPIERTEQSDSSDGIVSSKGNRKERRRNTKKTTADNQLEATVSVIDIDSDELPIERTEQSDSSDGIVSSKGNRKERRRNTKKSTADNQLEATVSVIDIDSAVLPIERTEQSDSSDGIASSKGNRKERRRNTKKSTADNQLEATVSVIDIDSVVLPIERTEQSDSSDGIASSKGNRKERRRDTKKSTADNQLEATVSVIDIDSVVLPIERTEQSDSSDGIASSKGNRKERRRDTKKSTADNQLEATVSVIDIDSVVLPIERTEQSDSSDGIASSKGNRKERRRDTKKSTADNQLEATVSVIDIDSVVLPIERTEQSDSSDGIASSKGNRKERRRDTKKSTADNQLEATVSVIDIDSAVLPIERTEQSDSSDGIASSKGNRKERRRDTKKSTADNQLEATVSVIDIDSAELPIERTEQSDSSDGIASSKGNRKKRRNTKKSTANNELETTVSIIDIDSDVLSIERTKQSNSSDGIISSKENRKKRRRNTKESTVDNELESTVSIIDIDSAVLPIERTEQSNSSDGIASSKENRKKRRRNTKESTVDNELEAIVSVIDIDSAVLPIERTEQSNSSDGIASSKENRKKRRRNTKESTVDNELEAIVSVIDIDSAVLPVEKADGRNSPEMLIEKSNRSTTNKKCKMQVSVIDTNVSLLPIERTEQSNPSDEVVSYKEKRRKGIKRLSSKEITPVSSNDEQIPVKRSKRVRLKKGGGRDNLKQSQDGQTEIVLEEDNSIDAETMKSLFSSSRSRQPIDIEDIIRKQREQYRFKENAEKRALQEKVASRQCTICDQILNSNEYKSHVESHKIAQEENRKYTCIECNKSFGVKFSLTRHMLIHNPVKPFQCSKCKCSFSDRSNLLKHERSHNTDKPFGCPFCPMVYADNADLLQHFRKSHKSEPEVPNVKNETVVPQIDHECYTKRAKSKQESKSEILQNGSAEHEDSDEDDDLDYFETFDSDNENELSELGDIIEVQGIDSDVDVIDMPIDDSDFWCSTCLTCFPTLSELEAHNEHHKKVKITCNICDKEFDTTNNLKDHYKLHFLLRTRKED